MPLGSRASRLSDRVFTEFFSRVSAAIEAFSDRFAGELLSECVIASEVVRDLAGTVGLTPTQRSQKVLFAVQNKIASAKSDKPLSSLCRVMEKFVVLKDLAKEMMERFGKCLPC